MLFKTDPLDTIEGALKKRNWRYLRLDEETIMTGVALAPTKVYSLSVRHDPERKTVVFLCSPLNSPLDALKAIASGRPPVMRVHPDAGHAQGQVAAVCNCLLNLNYGMLLGNFERDETDGEIRFRVAVPYRDARLSSEQACWCIDVTMLSIEHGMQKIEEILSGGAGALAAKGGKLEV